MIGLRIFSFLKFYLLTIGLLFVLYSLIDIGLRREIFLFLAVTILSPYLFKTAIELRGVRSGDLVLVSTQKEGVLGFFVEKVLAKALTNGKIGDVVEISYEYGRASAEVLNYGGLFFPPEVGLLCYEKPIKRWRDEFF